MEIIIFAQCATGCGRTLKAKSLDEIQKAGWALVEDGAGLFGKSGRLVYICPTCRQQLSKAISAQG